MRNARRPGGSRSLRVNDSLAAGSLNVGQCSSSSSSHFPSSSLDKWCLAMFGLVRSRGGRSPPALTCHCGSCRSCCCRSGSVLFLQKDVKSFYSRRTCLGHYLVMEQKNVFSPSTPARQDSSSQPSVRWLQKLIFGRAGSLPGSAMICAAITRTSGGV